MTAPPDLPLHDNGSMASDLRMVLDRLLQRWRDEQVGLLPPASAADVRAVFEGLGAVATPDVIALYAVAGGMKGVCHNGWRYWPLEEVAAQQTWDRGMRFADFMCGSWEHLLVPTAGECSAVHVAHDPCDMGPTLEAFLRMFESDPEFTHWRWG